MASAQVVETSVTVRDCQYQSYSGLRSPGRWSSTYFLSITHVYLKENLILKTSVWRLRVHTKNFSYIRLFLKDTLIILGDPGADSGGERKSKQAEKYGTKKSKERREEPLGTVSYQTSSKRSPPFCLLIGARKLLCFSVFLPRYIYGNISQFYY